MSNLANLLVAEDNDIDAERVVRCAARAGLANPIVRALNGIEALKALRGDENRRPLGTPRVVFVDLNMPKMNGLEFLSEVRMDPALAATPVIVLTTSELPSDIAEAARLGANGYLVKPISADQLVDVVRGIEQTSDEP